MLRTLFLALATVLLAAAQVSRLETGTVRGIIREPGNKPLPGATVVIGPDVTAKVPGLFSGYAITDADGRFEIANVPPGSYSVCPQFANSDYLNPCIWSEKQTSVTIPSTPIRTLSAGAQAAGAQSSGNPATVVDLDLILARGTSMYVQVDDPNALLSRTDKAAEPDLTIGVRSASGRIAYAYPPMTKIGGQRIYRVIVPLGAPFVPMLDSGKFIVQHGGPGELLDSPFDKVAESKIGEAAKVFRVTVRAVAR